MEQAHRGACDPGDGIGEPYIAQIPTQGQQIGGGGQDDELACQTTYQAGDSAPNGLEACLADLTEALQNKIGADDSQGVYADGQHFIGGVKHLDKLAGEQLEQRGSD